MHSNSAIFGWPIYNSFNHPITSLIIIMYTLTHSRPIGKQRFVAIIIYIYTVAKHSALILGMINFSCIII